MHHIIAGQLVTVRVPHAHRGVSAAKARLVGYQYYTAVGGQRFGAVVTYTADHGEPFARHRRERGESEVVPFDRVLPRGFAGEGKVTFHYDENVPAYAGIGPVHTSSHHHPTGDKS